MKDNLKNAPNDDHTRRVHEDSKNDQMENARGDGAGQYMTTDQGVRVNHTDDSLKAGTRGATLMEDFHFREKITALDHESIPERVVHARGSGAHGYFQPYESMKEYTRAAFLQDPSVRTPVFVRFSTVVGSRGSADTVRDVRGFATKFYTSEGNYDLVGNNIPVFFIQDAIKFLDLVHSIKPEPDHEMPQASAAHDTFWDFASLMPESAHMLMWILSDRAIPRSFRMMEGFGVHTFRFVNEAGKGRFVKLHWRPTLGTYSLVWDEAQKLAGKDPDWLRRDLWEAIENGSFPEFELSAQIVEEEDEHSFAFDLLDPTKIIPEEIVALKPIGKMVLNRNPDNFFAETEQVAFHPANVVPGIDFTNDPLLQGRLFSYLDTQINRFHSKNFHELPINSPVVPVHNHQGAGFMRRTINKGKANYSPNSLSGGCPMMAPEKMGGYVHYAERVDGNKIRERSESFKDHFSQATLFWNSMSEVEKKHIIEAAHFELGKVESKEVRTRLIHDIFNNVNHEFAAAVAKGVGVEPPANPAVSKIKDLAEKVGTKVSNALKKGKTIDDSPALSIERKAQAKSVKSRKVAILLDEGFDYEEFESVRQVLLGQGAGVKVVSMFRGMIRSSNGTEVEADKSHITTASIMFDAVYIPGGKHAEVLMKQGDALHFINEAFKHCKPVGAVGDGIRLLEASSISGVELSDDARVMDDEGVVTLKRTSDAAMMGDFVKAFVKAIQQHRHWMREAKVMVPA